MMRFALIPFLILSCLSARAEEAPPQHNFLFILDTSISMAARKPAVARFVRELVTSGFHKQIADGDSIDIWTYDTETHLTEFPPQIWENGRAGEIAESLGAFVEKKSFHGRTRFDRVAGDLDLLVPHTKGLLVLVLTDGEEPVSGIEYDVEINEWLSKLRKKNPVSKDPVLISMLAVDGRFTDWRLFAGKGLPALPQLPNRAPKTASASSEIAKATKPEPKPAASVHTAKTPVVLPAPRFPEPQGPPVLNFPPGTLLTPAEQPVAQTTVAVTVPVETKVVSAPETNTTAAKPLPPAKVTEPVLPKVISPVAPVTNVPVPSVAAAKPTHVEEKPSPSPQQAALGTPSQKTSPGNPAPQTPTPRPKPATVEAVSSVAPPTVSAEPPKSAASSTNGSTPVVPRAAFSFLAFNPLYVAMGGGLLCLGIALVIVKKSKPKQPSLISRSFNQ